ncbi:hypothetical protein CRE_08957 [Caenorhabditis remanei]|uniref:G-protein coupled receptors family 1 profile domain-containing protein n=1 Tax=Caenorhabditis remanei TaxID=31234 RepID=E3LIG9_CAERE|nr:hypothetical protein CRE_08957 [Caenorhabditis remanei]
MDECSRDFSSQYDNSTIDFLCTFMFSLENFVFFIKRYESKFLIPFIIINTFHFMVLTRKSMRTSSVNLLIAAVAFADICSLFFQLEQLLLVLLPCIFIPIVNFMLVIELWKNDEKRKKIFSPSKLNDSRKTTKLVFYFSLTFFIAQFPYGLVSSIMYLFVKTPGLLNILTFFTQLFMSLITFNTVTHFIVCIFMSSQYRITAKSIILCGHTSGVDTTMAKQSKPKRHSLWPGCLWCRLRGHSAQYCESYTVEERWELVRRRGWCHLCLTGGHHFAECRGGNRRARCRYCHAFHNPALCYDAPLPPLDQESIDPEKNADDKAQENVNTETTAETNAEEPMKKEPENFEAEMSDEHEAYDAADDIELESDEVQTEES